MRLLTHNVLSHNSQQGKGFPLRIRSAQVRVDDSSNTSMDVEQKVAFVKGLLPTLDWSALVMVRYGNISYGLALVLTGGICF